MDYPKYHYMVVDDDQFTRDLISRLLRKQGALNIECADDGKTAIARIHDTRRFPDIIICDLNMPDMDGVEFVNYLAEEMFTGGLILISGSDKVILNAVSRLGKAYFLSILGTLSKPFSPDQMMQFIAAYDPSRKMPEGKALEG